MKMCKSRLVLFVFMIAVLNLFVSPFSPAAYAWDGLPRDYDAVFPNALISVEEEAFEGTSFRTLIFQEGLLRIGNHAFSGTESLTDAYFPRSTEYIADSAFSRSTLERFYGCASSYVQEWAEQHDIEFKQNDCCLPSSPNLSISVEILLSVFGTVCLPIDDNMRRIKRYLTMLVISMRPQDRPELPPIDYRFP